MTGWIIAAVIILLIFIKVEYELHHLKVTEYRLESEKIPAGCSCRIVFISDLHLRKYGENNEKLVDMITKARPDVILIGGDMTIRSQKKNENVVFDLLERLVKIAPVYYAPGNHEAALKENAEFESDRFEELIKKCGMLGVRYLSNETEFVKIRTDKAENRGQDEPLKNNFNGRSQENKTQICVTGLDLSYDYYDKTIKRQLTSEEITGYLGKPDPDTYNILLAHPPAFFDEYVKYGADLVLAGHYHGGAVRFGKVGLVSPQKKFFPKFSAGKFEKNGTTMIVTRGAGSHSVNLRLFNYPEIVMIIFNS